jgi:Domain of unknown function (DUF1852)
MIHGLDCVLSSLSSFILRFKSMQPSDSPCLAAFVDLSAKRCGYADSQALGLTWKLDRTPFNIDFVPSEDTRATTNYANLARDPVTRKQNLSMLFGLINQVLNQQMEGDSTSTRYTVSLDILSVRALLDEIPSFTGFRLTEVMCASVLDTHTGECYSGPTGLNFSSYLRDYDFKVIAPKIANRSATLQECNQFGKLHGVLSQMQFGPSGLCPDPLTVAISISQKKHYMATEFVHSVLGREYLEMGDESVTTRYFRHMALAPRFFRPPGFPAPLAIYSHRQKIITERRSIELAVLIAVMGTFQRIYRPEIYMAREGFQEIPGGSSQLTLGNTNFDVLPILYDKVERDDLALLQAQRVKTEFLQP